MKFLGENSLQEIVNYCSFTVRFRFSQKFVFKRYHIPAWQSVCQSDKIEHSVSKTRSNGHS